VVDERDRERERVRRGEIHHRPWPLQPAQDELEVNQMAEPLAIELDGDPLLHYSARQDTLMWALTTA
jgi:hypothetical protein